MSAVLTPKLPSSAGFGSSRLFNGGPSRNPTAMMYQQQHAFPSPPVAQEAAGYSRSMVGSAGGSTTAGDPVRAAVTHLLTKTFSLPCSTAAHSFSNLVQPTSRFQLALDALLPILESNNKSLDPAQRILVSFILYSLYAPHPIAINPFKSVLYSTFVKERDLAVNTSNSGGAAPNEPFVWVLWKILKGDGNDIGPYSPSTLARSPLPPKLKATNLFLDDEMYYTDDYIDDPYVTKPTNTQIQEHTQPITSPGTERYITADEDDENEKIAHAMQLLLDARERVLTLSEQRVTLPMITQLVSSRLITPLDLAPIISCNPTLSHPLCVALIGGYEDDREKDTQYLAFPSPFLEVLTTLPPTLATFDLMGRLLRDNTPAQGYGSVADLVKEEVLGRFISQCIAWLENAEREEREGLISDDRFAKGLQNLCRFYHSLIKLAIVNPSAGDYSVEIQQFSLRYARFEEANALYRALATSGNLF